MTTHLRDNVNPISKTNELGKGSADGHGSLKERLTGGINQIDGTLVEKKQTITIVLAVIVAIITVLYLFVVVPVLLDARSIVGATINHMNSINSGGVFSMFGESGVRILMIIGCLLFAVSSFMTVFRLFMNKSKGGLMSIGLLSVSCIAMVVSIIAKFAKSARTLMIGGLLTFVSLFITSVLEAFFTLKSSQKPQLFDWIYVGVLVFSAVVSALLAYVFYKLFRNTAPGAVMEYKPESGELKYVHDKGDENTLKTLLAGTTFSNAGFKNDTIVINITKDKATLYVDKKRSLVFADGEHKDVACTVTSNADATVTVVTIKPSTSNNHITIRSYIPTGSATSVTVVTETVQGIHYTINGGYAAEILHTE